VSQFGEDRCLAAVRVRDAQLRPDPRQLDVAVDAGTIIVAVGGPGTAGSGLWAFGMSALDK
jgi:hypothetical protein